MMRMYSTKYKIQNTKYHQYSVRMIVYGMILYTVRTVVPQYHSATVVVVHGRRQIMIYYDYDDNMTMIVEKLKMLRVAERL